MASKKKNNKKINKRSGGRKKGSVKGHGDYDVRGVGMKNAVLDMEKRVNKLEGKVGSVSGQADAIESLMTSGGAAIGGMFGAPHVGAALGKGAHKLLASLRGSGDYEVNSLVNPGSERAVNPSVVSFGTSNGAVRVQKREFVGYVTTSSTAGAFSTTTFRINPGSPALFPYQSGTFALGFKRWRPLGLVIEMQSIATEYSTAQPLGLIGAAINYDNQAPAFTNTVQAQMSSGAVVAKISENVLFGVECAVKDRGVDWLYVRNGPVPTTADINLYDLGYLQVFTQGCSATSAQVAELWAVCDFEYECPLMLGGLSGGAAMSWLGCTVPGGAATPADPMGSLALDQAGSFTVTNTINKITLPNWLSGQFLFTAIWQTGTAGTFSTPNYTLTNCTRLNRMFADGNDLGVYNPGTGTTSFGAAYQFIIDVPLASSLSDVTKAASISFDNTGAWPSSSATAIFSLVQVDSAQGTTGLASLSTSVKPWT